MNTKSLSLFACLLAILCGCVFISEPDVGASGPGPELGNDDADGAPDDRGEPSEVGSMQGGTSGMETDLGNQTDAGSIVDPTDDGALPSEEDAQVEETQDSAVTPVDSGMVASDAGTQEQDTSVSPVGDMQLVDVTDATVTPPERD
jgi:hypothetical protein